MLLRRRELLGVAGGLVLGGVGTWAAQRIFLSPADRTVNQPPAASGPFEPIHNADEAWDRLRRGNQRFVANRCQFRSHTPIPTHMLARDFRPYAVILTCSDSRIAAEMLFDERLSEIFVVRQAAHLLDAGTRTSIEYAVGYLRVPLVVVLGHDQCLSLATTIGVEAPDANPPAALLRIREELNSVIKEVQAQTGDPLHNAVNANVRHAVRQLRSMPSIRENPRVQIRGARWLLPGGEVEEIKI